MTEIHAMFVGMQQQNNGRPSQSTDNRVRTVATTTTGAPPNRTEQNQNNARQGNGRGRGRGGPARRGRRRGGCGAWNGQWNSPTQQPATTTTPTSTQPATDSTAECMNSSWTHWDGNCSAAFSVCYKCKGARHFARRSPKRNTAPAPNNRGTGPRMPTVGYGKLRETRGDCKHTLREV